MNGLSCSTVCGIFLDQRSNLYPVHWQADSQPHATREVLGSIFITGLSVMFFRDTALLEQMSSMIRAGVCEVHRFSSRFVHFVAALYKVSSVSHRWMP